MTRSVLKLLEENRKTIQSLQNVGTVAVSSTTITAPIPNAMAMDITNTDLEQRTVKEIIEDLLEQEQWRNQRASKLDLDDFLQLLVEFNSHGIHFS
jgi:hypothetical protein